MTLLIKTTYHDRYEPVRVNRSSNANRAVAQCVYHMQVNHYGATVAEVYDAYTGELHAQVRRYKSGEIKIVYRRDPRKFECRIAASALFDAMERK
jgi:hypothetical protein